MAASRRALYAARDLERGAPSVAEDIVALRPAEGLSASRWHDLVGRRLPRAIAAGSAVRRRRSARRTSDRRAAMRRNVLITAASRRVPLVEASSGRCARPAARVIVTDVNPLSPAVHVADAAYRVPLATDPGYVDALAIAVRGPRRRPGRPDDRRRARGLRRGASRGSTRLASASRRRRPRPQRSATTSCGPRRCCARAASPPRSRGCRPTFRPASRSRCSSSRGTAAAVSARFRSERARVGVLPRYVPARSCRSFSTARSSRSTCSAIDGGPLSIVPRERVVIRAGVIDRGRTVRTDAHRAGPGVRGGARVSRPGQHPVPDRRRQADGVRDQPALLGRHPAHDRGRRRFPRMLVHLARGRRVQPSIGHFTAGLWMTSYEAAIFLQADEAGGISTVVAPIRVVA